MGIDLGDLVQRRPVKLADYRGQWVAFDAWNILYQFLSSIRQPDGTPLKDQGGAITSHLAGTLYRTSNLVEAGIRPVFVFDGAPHALKQETLTARATRKEAAQQAYEQAVAKGDLDTARTKAQQTSRLSVPMAEEAKELLTALGLPVVQAPGEGEAQAARMCAEGMVHATCSQDFDAMLFGSPLLVRNLTMSGRRKLPGKQVWVPVEPEEIDLAKSLDTAGLTREGLIDVALLVGTDFHPGVKGIGPKKAIQLLHANDGLEPLLDRLSDSSKAKNAAERAIAAQMDALVDREEIRKIFLDSPWNPEADLRVRAPDRDAVLDLMVERHQFSPERVSGAIERFEAARGMQSQQSLFDF